MASGTTPEYVGGGGETGASSLCFPTVQLEVRTHARPNTRQHFLIDASLCRYSRVLHSELASFNVEQDNYVFRWSSESGLESRQYGRRDPQHWLRYPQLALTTIYYTNYGVYNNCQLMYNINKATNHQPITMLSVE
jgi:hypothetical protein